jgi:polyhydroxyalkanoate synthesis regulator protein
MQGLVPRYLELSMDRLMQEQTNFREQMSKTFGGFPLGRLDEQVRANMQAFNEAMRMFTPFAPGAAAAAAAAQQTAAAKTGNRDEEVSALKRELNAMKARLDKLDEK